LLIALAMSFALTPIVMAYLPEPLPTGFGLFVVIAIEVIIGLFMGGIARILMSALDTAGMVASFQSGLSNAQLFNPAFAAQGSLLGAFFSVTGVVVLFASDLYLILLWGLVDSYKQFPVGGLPDTGSMAEVITRAVSISFLVGIQIAAPFILVAFLLYVGMGVLARLMPQVQVFILSLPVQILLSMLTMALTISAAMMFWLGKFQDGIMFLFSS
jgi:flagellar biosynthetic protein FliR